MPAVAGLLFRMKQNAVGLASIAVLAMGVLVMISTTVSLYSSVQDTVDTNYPQEVYLSANQTENDTVIPIPSSRLTEIVESTAEEYGLQIEHLVIQACSLDELICESVRKLAPQFVEKRLRLVFVPTEASVVTDAKWFACILDQLLSNAVKYTPAGAVTIGMQDGRLMISDTGIGVAHEDLPRIFEKGYTGINGRLGQKSSGLGLYLAKKAADLIAVPLTAESAVGVGSTFTLDLRQK